MKYTNEQYAESLLRALKEKSVARQKEITKNFLLLLSKRGDFYRLPLILEKFEKSYNAQSGLNKIKIEYPDKTFSTVKKQIEKILGKKIVWEEKTNPSLLAGIKILINEDTLIDASAKRQLDIILPRNT